MDPDQYHTRLGWKETSSGRFERFLDPQDIFMINACQAPKAFDREHWTINATASIHFFDAFEQTVHGLKIAGQHLRHHHPAIASILDGHKLTYQVADKHAIEEWLAHSFWVETGSVHNFMCRIRPRKYSTFHLFPATSEILIRLHHWQADATAALDLLDQVLRDFSQDLPAPTFGDEWQNLSPCFAAAARFPPSGATAFEQVAEGLLLQFTGNLPSIGLPSDNSSQEPAGTKRVACSVPPETTAKIVGACKQRGYSVASAVHAAITVATQEMKADSRHVANYTSFGSFNYRPYMPKPFNDAQAKCPLGQYFLGLPFTRPSANFESHAIAFQDFYHQPLHPAEAAFFNPYLTFVDKMTEGYKQSTQSDFVPTVQPSLSSLGLLPEVIQKRYRGTHPVVVEHVEIVTDMMVPGILVFQWSWQGQFFLSGNYNAAWMKDAVAEAYLTRVSEILLSELGISENASVPDKIPISTA